MDENIKDVSFSDEVIMDCNLRLTISNEDVFISPALININNYPTALSSNDVYREVNFSDEIISSCNVELIVQEL